MTVAGPKGDTEWERTIDYINFGEQCWAAAGVWGLQVCVQLLLRGGVGCKRQRGGCGCAGPAPWAALLTQA